MSEDSGELTLFQTVVKSVNRKDPALGDVDVGIRIQTCDPADCDGIHVHVEILIEGVTGGWVPVAAMPPTGPQTFIAPGLLADVLLTLQGRDPGDEEEGKRWAPAFHEFADRLSRHFNALQLIEESAEQAAKDIADGTAN